MVWRSPGGAFSATAGFFALLFLAMDHSCTSPQARGVLEKSSYHMLCLCRRPVPSASEAGLLALARPEVGLFRELPRVGVQARRLGRRDDIQLKRASGLCRAISW